MKCACHSGRAYHACCGPYHRGTARPETPEALMRSRYAAFAMGLGGYLLETLAETHEDRSTPAAVLVKTLSTVKDTQRFLGLTILDTGPDEVLFFAKIFEKGKERSFVELSSFVRERQAWRYASGIAKAVQDIPGNPLELDRVSFLRVVGGHP